MKRLPLIKLSLIAALAVGVWAIYLDAVLLKAISGRMWAQPAVIYARPLELYEGAAITSDQLHYELQGLGYKKVSRVKSAGEYSSSGAWTIYGRSFKFDDGIEAAQKSRFVLKNGRVVDFSSAEPILRLDPLVIGRVSPSHAEDRLLLPLDEVPETLQQLLVASEDRNFYAHYGISLRGISRAFIANIKSQRLAQGGSTLTQQLIKNYFLTSERSLSRKVTEVMMALLLEFHLDKNQILESYINEIYLAQNGPRAVHGFGLASQYFFEKPLRDLDLHEQALLVALVRGPSYYNPLRQPERAQKRRDLMLELAASQGFISEQDAELFKQKPLGVVKPANRKSLRQPAYLDLVKTELQEHYTNEDLSSAGLRVFTYFDPWVQHASERGANDVLASVSSGSKDIQMAQIVAKPDSGNILAVMGSRDARYPGYNRAVKAKRPVGSVIKPAVYLTALMQPERYHLLSPVMDEPLSWPLDDGTVWEPKNFDKESHGEVRLYQALSRSYNQATAALGKEMGLEPVANNLRQLGLPIEGDIYPSALLGAMPFSVMEVAQMYQTMASSGFFAQLNTVRAVANDQGSLLSTNPLMFEQRFESEYIALLQFALNQVTLEGSGKSLSYRLPKLAVAGKTGTSNQQRDSWFAGFTGDYLAVTWMGFDDNRPTEFTGASGALRVWAATLKGIAQEDIYFPQSDALSFMGYQVNSEKIFDTPCNNSIVVPFISGYSPEADVRCVQKNTLKTLTERVLEWFR